MGGIGIWQLLIVAVIVVLLFGTKKLRTLGSDLGSSIKGFKNAINEDDKDKDSQSSLADKSVDKKTEAESVKEKDQA